MRLFFQWSISWNILFGWRSQNVDTFRKTYTWQSLNYLRNNTLFLWEMFYFKKIHVSKPIPEERRLGEIIFQDVAWSFESFMWGNVNITRIRKRGLPRRVRDFSVKDRRSSRLRREIACDGETQRARASRAPLTARLDGREPTDRCMNEAAEISVTLCIFRKFKILHRQQTAAKTIVGVAAVFFYTIDSSDSRDARWRKIA